MKNNINYDNEKPFKKFSDEDTIETAIVHSDKTSEVTDNSNLYTSIFGLSLLGVFSYHFAPELITLSILPLSGIAAMVGSLCFIKK